MKSSVPFDILISFHFSFLTKCLLINPVFKHFSRVQAHEHLHRDATVFLSLSFVIFRQKTTAGPPPSAWTSHLGCATLQLEVIHMRSVSTGCGLRWVILSCYIHLSVDTKLKLTYPEKTQCIFLWSRLQLIQNVNLLIIFSSRILRKIKF